MDEDLKDKERELQRLGVEEEIADKRMSIAQRKAIERDAKRKYGPNWRKVLGIVGNIRVNREAVQTLYSAGSDLKELNRPGR